MVHTPGPLRRAAAHPRNGARVTDLTDLEVVVKRLREQRGMSQNALARAVHHDRSYLSKALRGVKPCGPALARLIDEALGADGEIIQAALRSGTPGDLMRPVSSLPSIAEGKDSDDPVKRREFGITTLGMLAAGIIPPPGRVPASVSAEHVRRLREAAADLCSTDWHAGGSALLRAARAHYASARAMLDSSNYTGAVGAELQAVTAELAAGAGFIAFDAAEQGLARALLAEAVLLAAGADDPLVTADAYSLLALQSAYLAASATDARTGLAREALRFLDQALSAVRHEASPKVHVIIAMRRARAYGLLGDEREVRSWITVARRELDQGGHPRDPHWTAFVTPSEVTAHEAMSALALGNADRAACLFRDVLSDASLPARNRALYRASLASALTAAGDQRQAAAEGMQVLPVLEQRVRSARTVNQLRPVRERAERDSEFAVRYDAVAAAS
jgi:transcriptional regulator with XRE-family HTH domain